MGKYKNLFQYLVNNKGYSCQLSFKNIESLLFDSLPASTRMYSAWWANSGHHHSKYWRDAGYNVSIVDFQEEYVVFTKIKHQITNPNDNYETITNTSDINRRKDDYCIGWYSFKYYETIFPELSEGNIYLYSPQGGYLYSDKKLHRFGDGYFCKFKISKRNEAGVYIWVVDSKIIYIGETQSFSNRINNGYGNIFPRNCYVGGQVTNCKMNSARGRTRTIIG